ncbi:nicotinate-nucleotide adenylyltransferase [Desulfocurvus sp. DL9XJH121]
MSKDFPVAVIHGRFQILHNDHLRYLLAGWELCSHLVAGVTNPDPHLSRFEGSAPGRSRPEANPLTYYERQVCVREALAEAGVPEKALSVVPLPINFPELYRHYVPMDAVFLLTIYDDWGREKQARFLSLGLSTHVLWERPPEEKGITATQVRRLMVEGGDWEPLVPPAVARRMREWDIPGRLARMAEC